MDGLVQKGTILRAGQTCDVKTALATYRDVILTHPKGYVAVPAVGDNVLFVITGPQEMFVINVWEDAKVSVSAGNTRVTNTVSFDNDATFNGDSTSLLGT